ncbi:hypothetical protein MMC07_001986 [Pseudocyphellaria aurata]|nr:hypothetical protein [Pseudocyphellaria aurata]
MRAISKYTLGLLLYLVTAVSWCRATPVSYGTISTSVKGGVLRATVNNPPINVFDDKLSTDFLALINSLKTQPAIKVVILASANPDFWITHFDIRLFSQTQKLSPSGNVTEVRSRIISIDDAISSLPVIFIAEINGRVTGAGGESAARFDIRYAGPGARLSQFEVGFNAMPGAGGLQYLVKLIGRARALEYILSGRTVDARTAAAIGWVNRAFGTGHELRVETDALAQRIASFSGLALAAIKRRINAASQPSAESIAADGAETTKLIAQPASQAALARYLKLSNNESGNAFELALTSNLEELNR